MKRKSSNQNIVNDYCSLEDRKLLAVGAGIFEGNLVIRGDADGPVQIQAIEQGTFEVTDNGETVGTIEGVTRGIRIKINDANGPGVDRVHVDLGGTQVGHVAANLGRGNNGFSIDNGRVHDKVIYRGNAAEDHVNLGADLDVGGSVFMRLGHGDNIVNMNADVGGGVGIGGGLGTDTINYHESAEVGHSVFNRLGGGENNVNLAGHVGGKLGFVGGRDADHVRILNDAIVENGAFLFMGHGDNSLDHWGTINGGLRTMAFSGNDSFELHEGSHVEHRTRIFMGGGENSADVQGTINSGLAILSTNPDDSVDVNEDLVAGRIYINLNWGGGGDDDGDE